jgi:amino-acid N-acetyltransferase
VTIPLIDSQILSTLELLHYCRRFQDALFAFSFRDPAHCTALLMDLRVVLAARIRQVIFCPTHAELESTVATWGTAGDKFVVIQARVDELQSVSFLGRLRAVLKKGGAPLVSLINFPTDSLERRAVEGAIVECSVALGASKIFFPGEVEGLTINGVFKSYPSNQEVHRAITDEAALNISPRRLQFLIDQQERHAVDVVLVGARRGAIFEEVFTHAGAGTLFTREYPNILRGAEETDVRDIMAIMQPYVAEGIIKPVTEEELIGAIRSFMVYSVNGQIVCAASLRDFGAACELAKLCTLPRYQARGRARALVQALIEEARARGKSYVFALTTQGYVGEFFEKVGFVPVDRSELPESWRAGYDFSRPSRAYRYAL